MAPPPRNRKTFSGFTAIVAKPPAQVQGAATIKAPAALDPPKPTDINTLPVSRAINSPNRCMNTIRSVCVYCGSAPGRDEVYLKAGRALGRSIAESGLRLIYGGGTKGIMGAVSDGALRA